MNKDLPPVDMDAVTAHLDRGWDLLKKNDLEGAEISARKTVEADPDAPEGWTLLGSVFAARGELDDALEQYKKAVEIDAEYPVPLLYAAEILMSQDKLDEALEYADGAIEAADEEEDYLDALLLRVEILIALEREDEAAESLEELPPTALPEASFHVRAARSFLDLAVLDRAEENFRAALELEPDDAEAWHGLGIVCEEREDADGMIAAWLKTRELDLAGEAAPWAVSTQKFEEIAEAALAELPEKIRKLLENVPIIASDYPSVDVIKDGYDPRMMGFFTGVPYPEKSHLDGAVPHLDSVLLFQRNIERQSRSEEEVAKEIRITLLHETGHFFGLDEDELHGMGLG